MTVKQFLFWFTATKLFYWLQIEAEICSDGPTLTQKTTNTEIKHKSTRVDQRVSTKTQM